MKGIFYSVLLLIFTLALLIQCNFSEHERTASEIASVVANKIMRETAFKTKNVPLKPVLGIQVLDYNNEFDSTREGIYYSFTNIECGIDTSLLFGISFSGNLKVYINGKFVYSGKEVREAEFKEIAYGMFDSQDTLSFNLKRGRNHVLIQLRKSSSKPIVYLRELQGSEEAKYTANFALNEFGYGNLTNQWLNIGPFDSEKVLKSDILNSKIKDEYKDHGRLYKWQLLKQRTIQELLIPESNSYKRESYQEWHYANGTVLFGFQVLAEIMTEAKYSSFVKRSVKYTLNNYELFKSQYETLHAFRGSNHRMFRKSMLDDTGAPALPYVQYYIDTKYEGVKNIINDMSDYVMNHQVRLEDGTFCRPEPVKMTVWADDLFMSVPFLLRMGEVENDLKYYDEAASQIIKFYNLLFDEQVGLCKHGWFSTKNERTKVFWGRANGWMIWAVTEALIHMPKEHKEYSKILEIYKNHIEGIMQYQGSNGMWHQVLDKPESFEETSCTAIYILALSRGLQNGWLDKSNEEILKKAWSSLKQNILNDGTVIDICRGTGIGNDYEFYFNRKRFPNDPRGLGAVITAASEMIKMGY